MNNKTYKLIIVLTGILVTFTAITLRGDLPIPIFIGLATVFYIDYFIVKGKEKKYKGKLEKETDMWEGLIFKRKTSIALNGATLLLAMISIYIKCSQESSLVGGIDSVCVLLFMLPLMVVYLATYTNPVKVYEKGIQIGDIFTEWSDISIEPYEDEIMRVNLRTSNILGKGFGGKSSIKVIEKDVINHIVEKLAN